MKRLVVPEANRAMVRISDCDRLRIKRLSKIRGGPAHQVITEALDLLEQFIVASEAA